MLGKSQDNQNFKTGNTCLLGRRIYKLWIGLIYFPAGDFNLLLGARGIKSCENKWPGWVRHNVNDQINTRYVQVKQMYAI